MEIKCLFEIRGASFCSENTFRLTKLSDCGSNIDDQTKRSHLSQHIGFVPEHELILNRSGLPHDLASEQLQLLCICENHRHVERRVTSPTWGPPLSCKQALR